MHTRRAPPGVFSRGNKVVAKCDLCLGRDIPACVANCPNEALFVAEDSKAKAEQLVLAVEAFLLWQAWQLMG
jgi:Fe-S-cluster-containing hydrogenase component 2